MCFLADYSYANTQMQVKLPRSDKPVPGTLADGA